LLKLRCEKVIGIFNLSEDKKNYIVEHFNNKTFSSMRNLTTIYLILGFFITLTSCNSRTNNNDFLLKTIKGDNDEIGGECGYRNQKGEMVIEFGKYYYCQTDTFRTMAIVYTKQGKIIAIDRNEKELFELFVFDNGPDPIKEGLFRIVKNGKIGYADTNGKIVIEPKYDCAFPFDNGKAKVSLKCKTIRSGEHFIWESNEWIYIDKPNK
jgi:hypothetical protein